MYYTRESNVNTPGVHFREEAASKVAYNIMETWIHCNVYTKAFQAVRRKVSLDNMQKCITKMSFC